MGGAGQALYLQESAVAPSLSDKKSSALKISGSNLVLKDKRIVVAPILPYDALRASRKNLETASAVSGLRALYTQVRTYFTQNP